MTKHLKTLKIIEEVEIRFCELQNEIPTHLLSHHYVLWNPTETVPYPNLAERNKIYIAAI